MRIANNVGSVNTLTCCFYPVEFKTAQIMFKARNIFIPGDIQKKFLDTFI